MPNRGTFRFKFGGVNLKDVPDALGETKFASALNVRTTSDNALRARPGYYKLFGTGGAAITDIRSYSTLDTDDFPRFLARDVNNRIWLDTGANVVSLGGAAGLGTSMFPFRPSESAQTWMYISGVGDYQKVSAPSATGAVSAFRVGVAEPPFLSVCDAAPTSRGFTEFTGTAGGWTVGGTASARLDGTRSNQSAGATDYDPADPFQRWSVQVDTTQNYATGEIVTFASSHEMVVADVIPPISMTGGIKAQSVFFYAGVPGNCLIVPSQMPDGTGLPGTQSLGSLRRGALVTLSQGGNTETVLVTGVITGPNQSVAFTCFVSFAYSAGTTITGVPTIVVEQTTFQPGTGQGLSSRYIQFTVTTGVGTLTQLLPDNAFQNVFQQGPVVFPQQDDYLHVSMNFSDPTQLVEAKLAFSLDSGGGFDGNVLYYSIRPGDLVAVGANQATQLETLLNSATDQFVSQLQVPGIYPPSQTVGGGTQWTEVMFPISSLSRLGGDQTKTISDATAVQIIIESAGGLIVQFGGLWVGGGGGPDVGDDGADYQYRVKARSSYTGVQGNPSPVPYSGVRPRRQPVRVVLPPAPSDPQIDTWDIYRYGGSVTSWRFIGSSPVGAGTFMDIYADEAALGGSEMVTDDTEPWPSVDTTFNFLSTSGPIVSWGNIITIMSNSFVFPAAIGRWLPGTIIQLSAVGLPSGAFTLRSRPIALAGGWQFEVEECVGWQPGWNYFYVLEPNLANQHLPYVWGPNEQGDCFGCGDPNRPGTISFTKDYNPDSVPTAYNLEICPPSEPLLGGEIMRGLSYVASSRRWWALYPAFNSSSRYTAVEQNFGREMVSPFGHVCDGNAIYFWAKDCIALSLGSGSETLTDADLYNLFPHGDVKGKNVTRNGVTYYAPDYTRVSSFRLGRSGPYLYANYHDSTGTPRVLVCDLRTKGWSQDQYHDSITVNWGVTQQAATLDTEALLYPFVVMGDASGNVYNTEDFIPDNTNFPIPVLVATREWDAEDPTENGLFDDLYLDCVAPGGCTAVPTTLGADVPGTGTTIGASPTRQLVQVQNGNGTLLRFMGLRVAWNDSSPGSTLLYQYQYLTIPNFVAAWRTRFISHGLKGYQTIYRIEAAYASTQTAVLSIASYDGTSPQDITLPSTGGVYQKLLLTPSFNKGQLFRYSCVSGQPFQLILGDWIIWVGEWGRPSMCVPYRFAGAETPVSVRI